LRPPWGVPETCSRIVTCQKEIIVLIRELLTALVR
jgi:hypothetical protein